MKISWLLCFHDVFGPFYALTSPGLHLVFTIGKGHMLDIYHIAYLLLNGLKN